MIKISLMGVIFIICTYLGNSYSLYFNKREAFYKELIKLCNFLVSEINFKKNTIENIFKSFIKINSSDASLNLYNLFVERGNFPIFLKNAEIETIKKFFNQLGTLDVDGESNFIKQNLGVFENLLLDVKEENKKFGGLGLKMGVIIGLTIIVVLI